LRTIPKNKKAYTAAQVEKHLEEGFLGQKMIVLPPSIEQLILSNPITKNFFLTAIGFYPNASYHHIERINGCQEYILLYCVSGEGKIFIQEKEIDIQPNTYFIVPKNTAHKYGSSSAVPWTIYWIHFSGTLAENIFKHSFSNKRPGVQLLEYNENRINLFNQIYQMLEHSFEERDLEIVNISLYYFISSIIYNKEINAEMLDNDIVSSSIKYMKSNLDKKLDIVHLANQQSISTSHYIRLFKQKMGLSPINYFNQLKIHQSCQYLYFTDKSIKEICVKLGFDDPYYFSRLFKKLMGISPSIYKKSYKQ
jgi:AraC-like DNA-binding protein